MRELCVAAFRNAELIKLTENRSECGIEKVLEEVESEVAAGSEKVLVASRNRTSSLFMDPAVTRSHPEIGILWMLRNPLDVLTSVHKKERGFYVEPYRLIASLNLYSQFSGDPQVLTVRYEELVSDPESVQNAIVERFGVETERPFADCHEHFPRFKQNVEALHSIRPIDSKSIEKWRSNPDFCQYLSKVMRSHPELVGIARLCGYEIDVEELDRGSSFARAGNSLKRVFATITSRQPEVSSAGISRDED
jgi:hypothetical protein